MESRASQIVIVALLILSAAFNAYLYSYYCRSEVDRMNGVATLVLHTRHSLRKESVVGGIPR